MSPRISLKVLGWFESVLIGKSGNWESGNLGCRA